ncbi:unnamed protein product [marine sediment metagenome]|uniref:Uncharacterized protein n=1 Tax=marine sediment metagenome TaxID=412755 RepID=X1D153_9ZZZZ
MAKINIASCHAGSTTYSALVVLTEVQKINGKDEVIILGEEPVTFTRETEPADIKKAIVDAGQEIMNVHKDGVNKLKDLEEMDFPDIK